MHLTGSAVYLSVSDYGFYLGAGGPQEDGELGSLAPQKCSARKGAHASFRDGDQRDASAGPPSTPMRFGLLAV